MIRTEAPKTLIKRKQTGRAISWLLVLASTPGVLLVQEMIPPDIEFPVRLVAVVLLSSSIIFMVIRAWKNEDQLENENERLAESLRVQTCSSAVLAHLVRMERRKADLLRDSSYKLELGEDKLPFFYNVHQYLRDVCDELEVLVSEVSASDLASVDVSLIYRYVGDDDWKWIVGKVGTSGSDKLNEFVRDPETLYSFIVKDEGNSPVFCNDKREFTHYKPGRRDRLFNGKGSVFATRLTYKNNDRALVECVLLVSTYGVLFVPEEMGEEAVDRFRVVLSCEVIPPFASLIEVELANLYARHNYALVRRLVPGGQSG